MPSRTGLQQFGRIEFLRSVFRVVFDRIVSIIVSWIVSPTIVLVEALPNPMFEGFHDRKVFFDFAVPNRFGFHPSIDHLGGRNIRVSLRNGPFQDGLWKVIVPTCQDFMPT